MELNVHFSFGLQEAQDQVHSPTLSNTGFHGLSVYYLPVLPLFSKSLPYLYFPILLNYKYFNKVPPYLKNMRYSVFI